MLPIARPRRARFASLSAVVVATAVSLVGTSVPAAGAARAPLAAPAALDTCQNPTRAFVSLEVAPEVTGAVPVGAGYHRLWDMAVGWKDVNPAPGVFNWTVLDQRVAQSEASGAVPMLVLGLTPQWAAADPNAGDPRWGLGTASPPADFNTFRAFVDAVVSRYGGRIGAYEVWNEANLTTFWTGTPDQMAEMTKIANDTIKAKNPRATITSASVTTRLRSPMARFVTPYARGLKARGLPFDAWAIHTYPAGDKGPDQRKSDIQNWQQVVSAAVGAGDPALDKQVWDTEVNYGLAGPGPTPPTDYSDADGAALIVQTYADSLALGIDATFWYLYTAASFDLLGVQFWAGTPLTTAAWAATRAKYAPGANLCAGGTTGGGGTSVAESLTIFAGCKAGGRLWVKASSTGLAGSTLKVLLKERGAGGLWEAVTGRRLTVPANGSFALTRVASCGLEGYVQRVKAKAGGVRSNVVIVTTK